MTIRLIYQARPANRTYPHLFRHVPATLDWSADVVAWCEDQFGRNDGSWGQPWILVTDGFAFREDAHAVAFRMVWC